MRVTACAMLLFLPGCANQEVKLVEIPVYQKPEVPPALSETWQPIAMPTWVPADDPAAGSCLAPLGEDALKALIFDMLTRIRAWEAWASEKSAVPGE